MAGSDDFAYYEFSAPALQQQQQLAEYDLALQERAAMLRATADATESPSLAASDDSSDSYTKRTAIIAGASGGGGVALILLFSLTAFLVHRRRRRRQHERERRLKAPSALYLNNTLDSDIDPMNREGATPVAVVIPVMVQRPRSVAIPRRGRTLESMLITAADRALAEDPGRRAMIVDSDENEGSAGARASRREEKTPAIGSGYPARWEGSGQRAIRPKVTITTSGWTNGQAGAAMGANVARPPMAHSPEDYKIPSALWRSPTSPTSPSPLQASPVAKEPVVLSWKRMDDEHSLSDDGSIDDASSLRRQSITRAAIVRSVHAGVPASVLGIATPGSARRRSTRSTH